MKNYPEILAPAGNRQSFLSALAAGADSIYCGLKLFSARMTAENFSLNELAELTDLAHTMNVRVYLAFNTVIKNSNLETAYRSIYEASEYIKPDALIIQDLSAAYLAEKSGFKGEIHYSTLSNITHPAGIDAAVKYFHADRIVLPRELSLEEIKTCAKKSLSDLEVFIHGALCYGVSGRCYWSSYLGGKSGLRGRCVQPCRRIYKQENSDARFFSCMDLSISDNVKNLLSIEKIRAWKIEGRKKGPHYVYSTVKAYKILRDNHNDSSAVRDALSLIDSSLGRKKTRYYFNRVDQSTPVQQSGESGSGLLAGKINNEKGSVYFIARTDLCEGDILRIGYEDSDSSDIIKISSAQPVNARIDITSGLSNPLKSGTPVFLIDRKGIELLEIISKLESRLAVKNKPEFNSVLPETGFFSGYDKRARNVNLFLARNYDDQANAYWLDYSLMQELPDDKYKQIWWWLPPVIWPKEEKNVSNLIKSCIEKGSVSFVLNSPWQLEFFKGFNSLNIWAGPFCNIMNSTSAKILSENGFNGIIISPELGENDILAFPDSSPLPLGIFINGNWPVCISRARPGELKTGSPFSSGFSEEYWTEEISGNFWTFPNWAVDLTSRHDFLREAGYSLFIYGIEEIPETVKLKKRPGLWNWNHGLM